MMPGHIDAMKGASVASVLAALGLRYVRTRGTTSPGHFACPACKAETRHTKARDRRGACGISSDGTRWRCFQCEARGDALDLVRHVEGRENERAWCERWLARPFTVRPRAPERTADERLRAAPPDVTSVRGFLASCVPVTECNDVLRYLESRGTDAVEVADRGLAFALPDGVTLPGWARWRGRPWDALGHRLIVPLVDATGNVRSVLARRVEEGESPKTLFPAGHVRPGLLMACPLARLVLSAGALPEWWAADAPRLRVNVTEGDSDFLTAAVGPAKGVRWGDADLYAPATLGIESGSWTSELAARLPVGTHVVIATDNDDAGDRYAATIASALAPLVCSGRLRLGRWRARQ
jgi:hypothetical protein